MTDRPILASDKERESVVDVLRDAYMDGRLTLAEFDERTSAAYTARTWPDLRALTEDLPAEPVFVGDVPQRTTRPGAVQPAEVPRQSKRERPLGRLLPVVFAWIMISAVAGSPDTAAALSVLFICLLACRIGYGGR